MRKTMKSKDLKSSENPTLKLRLKHWVAKIKNLFCKKEKKPGVRVFVASDIKVMLPIPIPVVKSSSFVKMKSFAKVESLKYFSENTSADKRAPPPLPPRNPVVKPQPPRDPVVKAQLPLKGPQQHAKILKKSHKKFVYSEEHKKARGAALARHRECDQNGIENVFLSVIAHKLFEMCSARPPEVNSKTRYKAANAFCILYGKTYIEFYGEQAFREKIDYILEYHQ